MTRRPLSLGQLMLRLGFVLACLAAIGFCAGTVAFDMFK